MGKIRFPKETVWYFTRKFLEQNFESEFSQTLCKKNSELIPGGDFSVGSNRNVKMPDMVCETGKPIGNIHSHNEPYFDRYPFDKGHSDEDIFLVTQKFLSKEIKKPYIGCVISPTGDDNGFFNGLDITCEKINDFSEDELRKVPTGIVHSNIDSKTGEKNSKEDLFGDEEIDYIKNHGPPRGGMFKSLGFKIHMANLKGYMMEEGILEQDGFHIDFDVDDEEKKTTIRFETEDAVLF